MSKEKPAVLLGHKKYFNVPGVSKRVYSHNVIGDVKVLSTNDMNGRPVVRLSSVEALDKEAVHFEVDGEHIAAVLCKTFPQGIYEFVITTQETVDRESQEDEMFTKRQKGMKKAAPLLKYQRRKKADQDPRVLKYYAELERKEEESLRITDKDRELAPAAYIEGIPVVRLERTTFPGQLKSDAVRVVIRSPFDESDTTQLRVSTQFAYAKRGQSKIELSNTKKVQTYAQGQVVFGAELNIDHDLYFSPNEEFKMYITVEDISSGILCERVITSEEFGQTVVSPKKTSVSELAAE